MCSPQAALTLSDPVRGAKAAGRAFFITNQEPRRFWDMIGDVVEGLGYRRPYIHLPFWLVMAIAAVFEYVVVPLVRPFKQLRSDFTVNRCVGAPRFARCPDLRRPFRCRTAARCSGAPLDAPPSLRGPLSAFGWADVPAGRGSAMRPVHARARPDPLLAGS